MQHIQTQSPARTLLLLALLAAAALLCVATSASPPVIDRITPGLGSSSVPVDQPLEIELERPADPDTVSHESVRLRRLVDDALVVATVELTDGNHRIVLGPDAPLDPETDYALELDLARLRDHDGNAYAGLRYDESLRSVWETSGLLRVEFTTRRELRVGRAFVVSDPDELLVYFSEAVDPTAVTTDSISLTTAGGKVSFDVRYNADENRLRVLPLAPLSAGQTYTLTLNADITTPDGATLGSGQGEALSFRLDEERIR